MSIFYAWSPFEKETKKILNDNMSYVLTPMIAKLGFIERGMKHRNRFPTMYWRVNKENSFDLFEFQWMTGGRPWFVVNFDRSEENPDVPHEWPSGLRFRARSNTGVFERWFGVGALESILRVRHAAVREINSAGQRLMEIDTFFKGGQLSPYLRQIISTRNEKLEIL